MRWLLCLLPFLLAPWSLAGEIVLDPAAPAVPLDSAFELAVDPSARLGYDAIHTLNWVPATPKLLNPGFSASAYWLRASLANPAATPTERWLALDRRRLREVTLFIHHADGRLERLDSGARMAVAERPLQLEAPAFPLRLAAREKIGLTLRVAGETAIGIDATLWQPAAAEARERQTYRTDFALYGGLGMVLLLCLLMFLTLRQWYFLFHFCSTLAFLVYEAGFRGYTLHFLWPASPEWDLRVVGCASSLGAFFHLLYLRSLLELPRQLPRWDRVLTLLAGLLLVPMVGVWFEFRLFQQATALLILIIAVVAIATSVAAYQRGLHGARFLLPANVLLWLAGGILTTTAHGGIPDNPTTQGTLPFAFVLSSLLILWAAVDRMTQLRREIARAETATREHLEETVATRTAELRDALNEAASANQTKDVFLAHVSHDLRAPLTAILGYAEMLERRVAGGEPRIIERSARHLLMLIDDLIEATRGPSAVLLLVPEPVRLQDFLHEIGDYGAAYAQKRGLVFRLETGDALPQAVEADAKRLRQVLLNLLSNATKFAAHGEVVLSCRGEHKEAGKVALTFSVADNGCGIAQDQLERIFEPFQRTPEALRTPGIGLGLTIVRDWVTRMGGQVNVASTPGTGARFSFTIELPILPAAAVPLPEIDAVPAHPLPACRVLIVEDFEVTREQLRQLCADLDWQVAVAGTVDAALAAETAAPFEVVVTDQFLPGGSGWDILRAIRQRHDGGGPAMILLSSAPPLPPEGWPSAVKFDATLLKPIGGPALNEAVRDVLRHAPSPPLPRPSPSQLAELAALAQLGAVSDILDWAAALAQGESGMAPFADTVADLARDSDIPAILLLAAAD